MPDAKDRRPEGATDTPATGTDRSDARRRLLKSLALGGGALAATGSLPDRWQRPAIDGVLLPAHAQATGAFAGSAQGVEGFGSVGPGGGGLLDLLVERADAQYTNGGPQWTAYLCAVPNGNGSGLDSVEATIERDWDECIERVRFRATSVPLSTTRSMSVETEDCFGFDLCPSDAERPGSIPFLREAHAGNGGGCGSSELEIVVTGIGSTITGTLRLQLPFYSALIGMDAAARMLDLLAPRANAAPADVVTFNFSLPMGVCNPPGANCGCRRLLL
jgi:hypothetical protein